MSFNKIKNKTFKLENSKAQTFLGLLLPRVWEEEIEQVVIDDGDLLNFYVGKK